MGNLKTACLLVCLLLFASGARAQNKARMLAGVNSQSCSTPYTFAPTDVLYLTAFNSASACTATLQSASTTGFGAGSIFSVKNNGAGTVTIAVTSGTIDGSSSIPLSSGQGADIYSDGNNYTSQRGAGTGGGGSGCTPGGSTNSLQKNNGAGGCAASAVTDTGSAVNVTEDFHGCGPNPYYDLTCYGLYAGSGGGITCSITISTNQLTCPGGIGDFAKGQGIEIPLAGVASTFAPWGVTNIFSFSRSGNVATLSFSNSAMLGAGQTATIGGLSDSSFNGPFSVTGNDGDFGHFFTANTGSNVGTTVSSGTATLTSANVVTTPIGVNGSTTWAYKIVMRGYHGELSAASPAGTTTTGAATLGPNSIALASCARSGGVVTCTSSAAHNFQANVVVDVEGTTNNAYNGSHFIASVPSSTTFTFYQYSLPNASGDDTGGTAAVVAKNMVQWPMTQYSVLQSIVYRSKNGGAYSVAGVVEGMDGAFVDWGLATPSVPGYVPATPPSSATNGILATTITGISGTTLTLATNAIATATSQFAQHDNTPIVLLGCAAIGASNGGELRIPAGSSSGVVLFNSPLDLQDNCPASQLTLSLGAVVTGINDTIIMKKAGTNIQAIPGSQLPGQQFQNYASARITGAAYPMFYFIPGSFGPNTLTNLSMECTQPYQSCVVLDQDGGGGGVASISFDNDTFEGTAGAMPFIMRSGGFNFWFEKGQFAVNSGAWGVPEALQITLPNALGGTSMSGNGWTLTDTLTFNKTVFQGHGIEFNNWGQAGTFAGNMTMNFPLIENPVGPFMSVLLSNSGNLHEVDFNNAGYADFLTGQATPFILLGSSTRLSGFRAAFPSCSNGNQPLFEGNITGGVKVTGGDAASCSLLGIGGSDIVENLFLANTGTRYDNATVELTGSGYVFYPMGPVTLAPTLALSSGGSVPVGVHSYQIAAIDPFGGTTLLGPATNITVTSGNQTVTVTSPTLPAGAVGWEAFRDTRTAAYPGCSYTPRGTIAATTPFVDTFGFDCGGYTPTVANAAVIGLGSVLFAPQMDLIGGGFINALTGTYTANRTTTFQDASGTVALEIQKGTLALPTTSIPSGGPCTVVSATATGADPTSPNYDTVTVNLLGNTDAVTGYAPSTGGMLILKPYLTANTVNISVCNNTANPIVPGAASVIWKVTR
jgi:hypothetical protein